MREGMAARRPTGAGAPSRVSRGMAPPLTKVTTPESPSVGATGRATSELAERIAPRLVSAVASQGPSAGAAAGTGTVTESRAGDAVRALGLALPKRPPGSMERVEPAAASLSARMLRHTGWADLQIERRARSKSPAPVVGGASAASDLVLLTAADRARAAVQTSTATTAATTTTAGRAAHRRPLHRRIESGQSRSGQERIGQAGADQDRITQSRSSQGRAGQGAGAGAGCGGDRDAQSAHTRRSVAREQTKRRTRCGPMPLRHRRAPMDAATPADARLHPARRAGRRRHMDLWPARRAQCARFCGRTGWPPHGDRRASPDGGRPRS